MKLSWNMFFQTLGFLVQGGNLLTNVVPAKYQPLVALGMSFLQGLVAWWAHHSNPDGTSALVAYQPKQ